MGAPTASMVAKGATAKGDGAGGCDCCGCCESGPVKAPDPEGCERWITDIPFLLAWIAFWVGMVIVMIMAISEGDLTRLLYFVDYNGNRCGDGALANYKYTHWTHPANTGTNVCVQSCPAAAHIKFTLVTTQTVGDKNIGYTVGATPDTATNCALTYANCATALSTATPAQLIAQSKADCCTFSAAPAPGGLYICVPAAVGTGSANQAKEYVDSSSALIVAATQDLITGWYIILCSALIAVIVSYIWLVVLKYSAGCFVWSIVFVANIFCFVATGAMYYLYDKYKTAYDDTALGQDQQMMYLCLIGLAIFGLLALILFCMTVCLCRQIAIAIKIIEAACDAINDIPSSVYFPLLQYFLMLIFIVYWVLVAAYMMSTGDYKQVSGASPWSGMRPCSRPLCTTSSACSGSWPSSGTCRSSSWLAPSAPGTGPLSPIRTPVSFKRSTRLRSCRPSGAPTFTTLALWLSAPSSSP